MQARGVSAAARHNAAAARPAHGHGKASCRHSLLLLCSTASPESSSLPCLDTAQAPNGGASGEDRSRSNGGSTRRSSRHTAALATVASATGCRIRPAEASDYWSIADLHCSSFYPRATPFWFAALRLDRVMALQTGKERAEFGNFLCLVAEGTDDANRSSATSIEKAVATDVMGTLPVPSRPTFPAADKAALPLKTATHPTAEGARRVDLGPLMDFMVGSFFPGSMKKNYASTYMAGGLQGVAVVDNFGLQIPTKRKQMPNGTIREVRRTAIAYLSNLAVAPCVRRTGIGRKLLHEAEQVAISWGCRSMALHVDPVNTAAVEMYSRSGYRHVMDQPEWQRWLEGRQKPLMIMMRALPRCAEPAPQSAAQQKQQGDAA